MSKKQINLFVGSVGAFIGVFVFIALEFSLLVQQQKTR